MSQWTERVLSHFTADLTYSQDFDYTIRPLQHLSDTATLLDWSITSGDYTFNSSNATLTVDVTDYFSTLFTSPLVQFNFQAVATVGGYPFSVTAGRGSTSPRDLASIRRSGAACTPRSVAPTIAASTWAAAPTPRPSTMSAAVAVEVVVAESPACRNPPAGR